MIENLLFFYEGTDDMILGIFALLSILASACISIGTGAFRDCSWLWMLPVGFLGSFLALSLLLFLFFWTASAFVRLDVPQEKDSPFYRGVVTLGAQFALEALQVRLHLEGMEQLPEDGRFLLVCNHLSIMDPVVLLKVFRKKQLAFISKRENDSMFLVGKLMHKIMCQPINRENDREALKTIVKCIKMLQTDQVSVGVFPEGYTSRDGLLHPFRSGVFKIAQKAKVPVVVCTIRNTKPIFHNAIRLRPTHVQLHLAGVISAEQTQGITAVELGNRVHEMMVRDLGPELVEQAPQNEDAP